jgi:hypothetical protein
VLVAAVPQRVQLQVRDPIAVVAVLQLLLPPLLAVANNFYIEVPHKTLL